jgi:hypothetical protein
MILCHGLRHMLDTIRVLGEDNYKISYACEVLKMAVGSVY